MPQQADALCKERAATNLYRSLVQITFYIKGAMKYAQDIYVSIRLDKICDSVMTVKFISAMS